MKYISVAETAKRWGVSERSVRGYCAEGKIDGAFLTGKTWNIPETAEKPDRMNKKTDTPKTLLEVLKAEKAAKLHGGIYHKIQIDLTYNSNHMEGSRLTHDQTRYIFETNTIGASDGTVKVDDVVETANHFKCIDMMIDSANHMLRGVHQAAARRSEKRNFRFPPRLVCRRGLQEIAQRGRRHGYHCAGECRC